MDGKKGNGSGKRGKGSSRGRPCKRQQDERPGEKSSQVRRPWQATAQAPRVEADFRPARPWEYGRGSRYPTRFYTGDPPAERPVHVPVPLPPLEPLMVPQIPQPFYSEPTVPALQFASNHRTEGIRGEANRTFYLNSASGRPPTLTNEDSQRATTSGRSGNDGRMSPLPSTSSQAQSIEPSHPEKPETGFQVPSERSDDKDRLYSVPSTSFQAQLITKKPEGPNSSVRIPAGRTGDKERIYSVPSTTSQAQSIKSEPSKRSKSAFHTPAGRCGNKIRTYSVPSTSSQAQSNKPEPSKRSKSAFHTPAGRSGDNIQTYSVPSTSSQAQSKKPEHSKRSKSAFHTPAGQSGDKIRTYSVPSTSSQAQSIRPEPSKRSKSAFHTPAGQSGDNILTYSVPSTSFEGQFIELARPERFETASEVPCSSSLSPPTDSRQASGNATNSSKRAPENSSTNRNQAISLNSEVAEIPQNDSQLAPLSDPKSEGKNRIQVKTNSPTSDNQVVTSSDLPEKLTSTNMSDEPKPMKLTLDGQPAPDPRSSRPPSPKLDSTQSNASCSELRKFRIKRPTPLYDSRTVSGGQARTPSGGQARAPAHTRPFCPPSPTPAVNVVPPIRRQYNQHRQTLNYNEFGHPVVQNIPNEYYIPTAPPMEVANGPFFEPPHGINIAPHNYLQMIQGASYHQFTQNVHIAPTFQNQYPGPQFFPQTIAQPQYFAPQPPVVGPQLLFPQQPFAGPNFEPHMAFIQQQFPIPENLNMGYQEQHFQVRVLSPPAPILLPFVAPSLTGPNLNSQTPAIEAPPPNPLEIPQESSSESEHPQNLHHVNDISVPSESHSSRNGQTTEGDTSVIPEPTSLAEASMPNGETSQIVKEDNIDQPIDSGTSLFRSSIKNMESDKNTSVDELRFQQIGPEIENPEHSSDANMLNSGTENRDLTMTATEDQSDMSLCRSSVENTESDKNTSVDEHRFQHNGPEIENPEHSSDANMSNSGTENHDHNTQPQQLTSNAQQQEMTTTEEQSDSVSWYALTEISLQNNTQEKDVASGGVNVARVCQAESDRPRVCCECGLRETTPLDKILICFPCLRLFHRLCINPPVTDIDTCVTFCMSTNHSSQFQSVMLSHTANFFEHFRKKDGSALNIKILPVAAEKAGDSMKLPSSSTAGPSGDIGRNPQVILEKYVCPSADSTAKTISTSAKKRVRPRKSSNAKITTVSACASSATHDTSSAPTTSDGRANNSSKPQHNANGSSSSGCKMTYASVVASGNKRQGGTTPKKVRSDQGGQNANISADFPIHENSSSIPSTSSGLSGKGRPASFKEDPSTSTQDGKNNSRYKKKRAFGLSFGKNRSPKDGNGDEGKKKEYRYTLDELPVMIQKLKLKAESFDKWVSSVQGALDGNSPTLDIDDLKNLLAEADEKKFPESELLQGLQLAILEAEKCASVAQQLDSSRMRTRTRLALDNRCKLTVEELTLFYEQIQELACRINEEQLIKGLVVKVREFQNEAKRLLALEVVESKALEQVLENGFFLNIDLKELPLLKEKLDQMKWLEEVEAARGDSEAMTVETMHELISAAESLLPFPRLDEQLAELGDRLVKARTWEEKASKCLDTSGKSLQELKTWEDLLAEADDIGAHLPSKATLRENLKKARDWITRTETTLEGSNYPYTEVVEDLLSKGQQLQVQIELMPKLEDMMKGAVLWKDRASKVFLRRNTPFSLMEVLVPRPELGLSMLRQKKRQRDATLPYVVCGVKLHGSVDPATVVAAFKKAEQEELDAMISLRDENEIKKRINSVESKFCVCRKPLNGLMNECALCKDWFHTTCVSLAKGTARSGGDGRPVTFEGETKFLCPVCMRSRRPPLDTVLTLLVALQALPVRLPEGEALQCLTERAMGWQDKARRVLECGEVKGALVRVAAMAQRTSTETAVRRKAEQRSLGNAPKRLMTAVKTEVNTDLQPRVLLSRREDTPSEDSAPASPTTDDNPGFVSADPIASYSATEHAYSTVSKARTKKHVRKTPLVPRTMEEPTVVLSQEGVATLQQLATEGDLMEVSLDEADVIWRLLQALRPAAPRQARTRRPSDDSFDLDESETEDMIKNNLKERVARSKRMFEDVDSSSSGNFPSTSSSIGAKKLKVRIPRDTSKKSQEGTTAGKPERKRRGRREGWNLKKTGTVKQKKLNTDEESEGEEEELCAALVCRRPTGSEVDWVQCDGGCELWFHMHCVGLGKNDINEDEDYICKQCLRAESFVEEEEMDLSQIKPEPGEGPDMVEDGLDLGGLFSTEEDPGDH